MRDDRSTEQIREQSERDVGVANRKLEGSFEWGPDSEWTELVAPYYEHIQKSCPRATQ